MSQRNLINNMVSATDDRFVPNFEEIALIWANDEKQKRTKQTKQQYSMQFGLSAAPPPIWTAILAGFMRNIIYDDGLLISIQGAVLHCRFPKPSHSTIVDISVAANECIQQANARYRQYCSDAC